MASTSNPENELVFMMCLKSFDGLNDAPHIEKHIQLETTCISGMRARVRKISPVKGGDVEAGDKYEFTIKVPSKAVVAGVSSNSETTIEVDRNFYENFSRGATRAVIKKRFSFPGLETKLTSHPDLVLPTLTYEVDVFINDKNQFNANVKVDVELDKLTDALKAAGIDMEKVHQVFKFGALPLDILPGSIFLCRQATATQNKLLDILWQKEFIHPMNPDLYVKPPKAPPVAAPAPTSPVTGTEQAPPEGEQQPDTTGEADATSA